jgi:hypothetical protein
VTEALRLAAACYRRLWGERVDRGAGGSAGSIICNDLTSPFDDFMGEQRKRFCTSIASTVAGAVAEILVRLDALEKVTPIPGLEAEEGS